MVINQQIKFKDNLKQIIEYIAKDNLNAAKKFRKDLFINIKDIPDMPKKYRKSEYYENENIRDMIFCGYTIIYEIYQNTIELQTIFNQNLPTLEKEQNSL